MMAREPQSGWFVEVPAELKKEFKRLYKGRAVMRKLTIAAIEWAIKERPNIQPKGGHIEDRQLRTDNASDLSGEV
jgi:hypothetical protein